MTTHQENDFGSAFPLSQNLLGETGWNALTRLLCNARENRDLPEMLKKYRDRIPIPDYLIQLMELETIFSRIKKFEVHFPEETRDYQLNPTLEIYHADWLFAPLFNQTATGGNRLLAKESNYILIWKHPKTKQVRVKSADDRDLLALKIVAEELSPESICQISPISLGKVLECLRSAKRQGFLTGPASTIKRPDDYSARKANALDKYQQTDFFTIQWHITNTCDLHCKHCYDRNKRSPLTLEQGLNIIKDFERFCHLHHVSGHVCFTGGNPFLSPHFFELYQAASDQGFSTSILGNPVPKEKLERLLLIQQPTYYQVSLEGLQPHNDHIRGKGNYLNVVEFLSVLRDTGITSAVQLTLTADNMDQVLPLSEKLRGHTNKFTFNRLSPVGEGASLLLPEKSAYIEFLKTYIDAWKKNPVLNLKDNLLNPILHEQNLSAFGGCTGLGCAAAFSFLAILPDGEVHACRKFPSIVGNVLESTLDEIYHSSRSEQYRKGSAACYNCDMKPVCGGCLAITSGMQLDPFTDRDPFCPLPENTTIHMS